MKLVDTDHPFFQPLWRRVAIVVGCFAWAAVETSKGNSTWAILFGAIGGYCAYHLLVTFDKDKD